MQEKEQDIKPKFQESDKHRIEHNPEKEQSSRIFAVYWTHDMYTGQPKLKAQCENRLSSADTGYRRKFLRTSHMLRFSKNLTIGKKESKIYTTQGK